MTNTANVRRLPPPAPTALERGTCGPHRTAGALPRGAKCGAVGRGGTHDCQQTGGAMLRGAIPCPGVPCRALRTVVAGGHADLPALTVSVPRGARLSATPATKCNLAPTTGRRSSPTQWGAAGRVRPPEEDTAPRWGVLVALLVGWAHQRRTVRAPRWHGQACAAPDWTNARMGVLDRQRRFIFENAGIRPSSAIRRRERQAVRS
jgi:hypothetical protein